MLAKAVVDAGGFEVSVHVYGDATESHVRNGDTITATVCWWLWLDREAGESCPGRKPPHLRCGQRCRGSRVVGPDVRLGTYGEYPFTTEPIECEWVVMMVVGKYDLPAEWIPGAWCDHDAVSYTHLTLPTKA